MKPRYIRHKISGHIKTYEFHFNYSYNNRLSIQFHQNLLDHYYHS